MVVLLMGFWLLLGCDNFRTTQILPKSFTEALPLTRTLNNNKKKSSHGPKYFNNNKLYILHHILICWLGDDIVMHLHDDILFVILMHVFQNLRILLHRDITTNKTKLSAWLLLQEIWPLTSMPQV